MRAIWKTMAMLMVLQLGAAADVPAESTTPRPQRNDQGIWDGTWVYLNRDVNVALWIRTENGLPQVKLRSLNRLTGEGFETDWEGQSSYIHDGWPGIFSLTLDERDANTMNGTWLWEITMGNSSRIETANVSFYRALDGRHLVLTFDDFKRTRRIDDKVMVIPVNHFWSFRKVSARLAVWDELPF